MPEAASHLWLSLSTRRALRGEQGEETGTGKERGARAWAQGGRTGPALSRTPKEGASCEGGHPALPHTSHWLLRFIMYLSTTHSWQVLLFQLFPTATAVTAIPTGRRNTMTRLAVGFQEAADHARAPGPLPGRVAPPASGRGTRWRRRPSCSSGDGSPGPPRRATHARPRPRPPAPSRPPAGLVPRAEARLSRCYRGR